MNTSPSGSLPGFEYVPDLVKCISWIHLSSKNLLLKLFWVLLMFFFDLFHDIFQFTNSILLFRWGHGNQGRSIWFELFQIDITVNIYDKIILYTFSGWLLRCFLNIIILLHLLFYHRLYHHSPVSLILSLSPAQLKQFLGLFPHFLFQLFRTIHRLTLWLSIKPTPKLYLLFLNSHLLLELVQFFVILINTFLRAQYP